jgi:hypothetical protein
MIRPPMSEALSTVLESAVYLTETPSDAENILIAALAALAGEDERETLSLAVQLAKVIADHRKKTYNKPCPHQAL